MQGERSRPVWRNPQTVKQRPRAIRELRDLVAGFYMLHGAGNGPAATALARVMNAKLNALICNEESADDLAWIGVVDNDDDRSLFDESEDRQC